MMRRQQVRHDCETGHVPTTLPPNVLSATMPWRCPTCGQRWWCEISTHSANLTRIGRPSRAWRRTTTRTLRQFQRQLRDT